MIDVIGDHRSPRRADFPGLDRFSCNGHFHQAQVMVFDLPRDQILLQAGSHYLTNAEFGCNDGDHKAGVIVGVDCKKERVNGKYNFSIVTKIP